MVVRSKNPHLAPRRHDDCQVQARHANFAKLYRDFARCYHCCLTWFENTHIFGDK